MVKKLSEQEIQDLLAGGASVESDNVELSLAGMVQLLNHVKSLVDVNKQIAAKNNSDMVTAINGLTSAVKEKSFKHQDLKPLVDVIIANNKPVEIPDPVAYNHTIARGSKDGRILSIKSTPVGAN